MGPARGGVRVHSPHNLFSLSLTHTHTHTHTHTLLIQYFYPFWSFLCWILIDFKSFSSLNSSLAFPLLNSVCTLIPPTHIYSKSPTYELSSSELSKMWTCVPSTSTWVKWQFALRLLLLTILQLCQLPPSLPPPVSHSSCLFTCCQPLCASYCTILLYFQGTAL